MLNTLYAESSINYPTMKSTSTDNVAHHGHARKYVIQNLCNMYVVSISVTDFIQNVRFMVLATIVIQ